MRTKFAALIGMIVILATSALPAQAAWAPADAPQYAGAAQSTEARKYTGAQTQRALGRADQDAFRNLAGGWHYRGGSWYYIRNGKAARGWIRDSGKWYFLGSDGRMKTGWLKIGEKTFYLTKSGARATGWRTIGDKRYCFLSNGVLDARKTKEAGNSASSAGKDTADKKGGDSSGSGLKTKGDMVAEYALKFVGNPYVYGGCSLTKGTDCSGFVMLIYRHFGVSLPHYDAAIRTRGKSVPSLKEARAGDIICYYGHVAIYLGDGRIVHASNSRDGIKISERADYREIASIRRIFD